VSSRRYYIIEWTHGERGFLDVASHLLLGPGIALMRQEIE
jgi:hypothetical protein